MREHELKFTPAPSFELPSLTDLEHGVRAGQPEELRLQAFYFDTDDLRLSRAGASLRYRSDDGWTVKLPVARGDALTRDEIPVAGDPGVPPPEALDLVRAIVRRAPLQLAARLTTLRRRTRLHDQTGRVVVEVVDDEVSVLDGMRLAARFRELEVEIAADAPSGFVESVVAALRAAGAGAPTPIPKIVRALGPRAMEPPDFGVEIAVEDASSLVRRSISDALARLVTHDPGVRIGTDPEAVHQARVATRRLRSDLRTFKPIVDQDWAARLRDELHWLGTHLGAVRDLDVMTARLVERLRTLPPRDQDPGHRVLAHLAATREETRNELVDAMRSERYVALLDDLFDAAQAPVLVGHHPEAADDPSAALDDATDGDTRDRDAADPSSDDTSDDQSVAVDPRRDDAVDAADLVRRRWKHLRDAVDALGEYPEDHALHEVRILAKRARYASEAVVPIEGKKAARFAKALATVQDRLGEHQDAVVAQQWLHDAAASFETDPTAAFVAGELAGGEHEAAMAARAAWPRTWRAARQPKLRRWL